MSIAIATFSFTQISFPIENKIEKRKEDHYMEFDRESQLLKEAE